MRLARVRQMAVGFKIIVESIAMPLDPHAILSDSRFIQVRDRHGHLWLEYDPVARIIRRVQKRHGKLIECLLDLSDLLRVNDPAQPIYLRTRVLDE